jgi:hypothetical protein
MIPTAYGDRNTASVGGLMSYGTSFADTFRQLGIYTGVILKVAKPATCRSCNRPRAPKVADCTRRLVKNTSALKKSASGERSRGLHLQHRRKNTRGDDIAASRFPPTMAIP